MKFFKFLSISCLIVSHLLFLPSSTSAATFFSGEDVVLNEDVKNLSDLYLFGRSIRVNSPVENDVVAGGGDILINNSVTGDLIAAGGNVDILSGVDGTVRIAGGDIVIDGPVGRDVVMMGGSLRMTKNASVGGDLVFTGGQLSVSGPIKGRAIINGGEVNLNSTVGGNVEGEVGALTISENAVINGDLRYKSEKKAAISDRAVVRGENVFQKIERTEDTGRDIGKLVSAGTYYKLATDILFSLLFVLLVPLFLLRTITPMSASPLRSGLIGFATLILTPVLSLFLLLIIWLGIFSFLLYFLLIILAMVVANIFVGNLILSWWSKRSKKEYILDWKAAVVGPVVIYILWFIPIAGWLLAFVIYLISLGGVILSLSNSLKTQKST